MYVYELKDVCVYAEMEIVGGNAWQKDSTHKHNKAWNVVYYLL